jgi:hypothetical protein
MLQSLSAIYIHLVFSTEERRPFLKDVATREALQARRVVQHIVAVVGDDPPRIKFRRQVRVQIVAIGHSPALGVVCRSQSREPVIDETSTL